MKYVLVIKNDDYKEHKFPQTVTVIKVVQANSFHGSAEFNQLQITKPQALAKNIARVILFCKSLQLWNIIVFMTLHI